MKISELSRATGVDVDTIRYYEKAGLLPPPAREANGYRSYADRHLERLAFGLVLTEGGHGQQRDDDEGGDGSHGNLLRQGPGSVMQGWT